MGKHFLQTSSETNYSKSGTHLETFWQSWLLNIRSADYQVKMSDIDTVIAKVVEDIWGTYDKDNSGALCKDETKQFVIDTLKEMADGDHNDEFNEEDFNKCFEEFDKNGSGTIERGEMAIFIKKVAGL